MIMYHVRTGTHLPRTKEWFDCRCKALEYVKLMLSKAKKGLEHADLLASVAITEVNDAVLPEKDRLFLTGDARQKEIVKKIYRKV